jgi:hypothetical protein
VADAIACLVERIRVLEAEAGLHNPEQGLETECEDCDAVEVCESNESDTRDKYKKLA